MSKGPNPLYEVVNILAEGNVDYKAIALELAKHNPTLFVRYAKAQSATVAAPVVPVNKDPDEFMYETPNGTFPIKRGAPWYKELMGLIPGIRSGVVVNGMTSKIFIIKRLREQTGMGLKDAKEYVENHMGLY